MALKGAPSARVAIPQGDIYPSGLPVIPPDPNIQATSRPENWLFRQSAGFKTIRPGAHRYQDGYRGPGIGFTPMRFAEDISAYDNGHGLPAIVDQDAAFEHADIADIPGSENLTSDGTLSEGYDGVKIGQGKEFHHHDGVSNIHAPHFTSPDMGDREPDRPLTRNWLDSILKNPVNAFRNEYATHPVTAILVASAGIAVAWNIGKEFERGAVRRGPASAAASTAGSTAQKGGNVASDLIQDAGNAVKSMADTVAEAVKI